MKFLVTVRPTGLPPPIEAVKAAREWLETRVEDGTFECIYAFPTGGGVSIGENESHEQLMDEMLDYPLSPFVEFRAEPLVEIGAAFDRFIPYMERMTAQLAGQAQN
jgi:hypothetical protein